MAVTAITTAASAASISQVLIRLLASARLSPSLEWTLIAPALIFPAAVRAVG
jgi:hypothetical protein